jgi:hypothetical protein
MLIKWFHRGTGNSSSALNYLLAEEPLKYLAGSRDRRGVIRNPMPAVIKGHPELTAKLINQCRNKHRYTSGVISCERLISKTDELEIIRRFEQVAFAGLKDHQVAPLYIRHCHLGRTEIHFLVPRTELTSLRALNINPPRLRNEGLYDTFRKLINHEFNLKEPSGAQLSPAERNRLAKKLDALVSARAAYNRTRYPSPESERSASLATLSTLDRTGPPGGGLATPGPTLSPAGPAARPAIERLGFANRTLSQTCGQLERIRDQRGRPSHALARPAVDQFFSASRNLDQACKQLDQASGQLENSARAFPQRLAQRKRWILGQALFSRYDIPESRATGQSRELDCGELSLDLADGL